MSRNQSTTDNSAIQKAIDQVLTEMEDVTADSPEFAKMVDQLVTLTKALPAKEAKVKLDTLITAGASLAGIIMILTFEKAGIVTSKALSFVMKAR